MSPKHVHGDPKEFLLFFFVAREKAHEHSREARQANGLVEFYESPIHAPVQCHEVDEGLEEEGLLLLVVSRIQGQIRGLM